MTKKSVTRTFFIIVAAWYMIMLIIMYSKQCSYFRWDRGCVLLFPVQEIRAIWISQAATLQSFVVMGVLAGLANLMTIHLALSRDVIKGRLLRFLWGAFGLLFLIWPAIFLTLILPDHEAYTPAEIIGVLPDYEQIWLTESDSYTQRYREIRARGAFPNAACKYEMHGWDSKETTFYFGSTCTKAISAYSTDRKSVETVFELPSELGGLPLPTNQEAETVATYFKSVRHILDVREWQRYVLGTYDSMLVSPQRSQVVMMISSPGKTMFDLILLSPSMK